MIHVPNQREADLSFLFPQRFVSTLKVLAGTGGVTHPRVRGKQSGCPRFGLGGSGSLCPLGTGTRFCYNKSCFRHSLLAPVLVCAPKPLGRGAQVAINPPPVPTMSVRGQAGTVSP